MQFKQIRKWKILPLVLTFLFVLPMPSVHAGVLDYFGLSSQETSDVIGKEIAAEQKIPTDRAAMSAEQKAMRQQLVFQALGKTRSLESNVIYTPHEKNELQMNWLIETLDRCTTSFGGWGLRAMEPTDDVQLITNRQHIIKTLTTDKKLYKKVKAQLQTIYKAEHALLAYWDPKDVLMQNSKSLYFEIPLIKDFLNKNRYALDATMALSMGKSVLGLAAIAGVMGLWNEFQLWSSGGVDELDIKRGLLRSFTSLKDGIDPRKRETKNYDLKEGKGVPPAFRALGIKNYDQLIQLSKNPQEYNQLVQVAQGAKTYDQLLELAKQHDGETFQAWANGMFNGTLGDRYKVLKEGYRQPTSIKIPLVGERKLTWQPTSEWPLPVRIMTQMGAPIAAFAPTAIAYYTFYVSGKNAIGTAKNLFKTMELLRKRVAEISKAIKAAQILVNELPTHRELQHNNYIQQMKHIVNTSSLSTKMKKLQSLLDGISPSSSIFYSRGRILLANKLLNEMKQELAPLLQVVGEIDALHVFAEFCSQANNPWTFVDFVKQDKPYLEIHDYRIPMYGEQAVPNSIVLGPQTYTKLLITGPNGGGKSVSIKLFLAQAIALAHMAGVIPATLAHMTIFNGMRTCLNPKENMKNRMSTFMAASAGVEALRYFIHESDPNKIYAVFGDELYRGTVNTETAARTGKFLKEVADKDQFITVIATHIMPELTDKERQNFGYQHVEIQEPIEGMFKRTFELKPDVCDWWFNDKEKRSRYVDWIKTQCELPGCVQVAAVA